YLELGDSRQAVPLLEDAVERWTRFQHRPMLGWFTAVLGEACLLAGDAFRAIGARFEAARTMLDLATGAIARRDAAGGARLAREALEQLAGLGAPAYEERARQLAEAA